VATTSKAQWKRSKTHEVTLPSGAEVKIELPDLAAMIKGGQIPNELLDVATKVGSGQSIAADEDGAEKRKLLGQAVDFNAFLIEKTVVDPKVTAEEVINEEIPAEDADLIVQLALRRTDFDAVGKHLGGLDTVPSFRKFRGLDSSIEDLLGTPGG
jgi:nucleotide-binding universal stress UspA family protein